MPKLEKTNGKQTQKNKFPPGNKVGNRFKPGESGNPKGRPKLTKLSIALREKLAEANPDAPEQTIAEQIADALIKEAKSGDVSAIREIGDRTEGKPKQAIDVDMHVKDWQRAIANYGISPEELLDEARRLLSAGESDESDS